MPIHETQDGVKFFYNDCGNGTSLVFLHGWMSGGDSWEDPTYKP